MDRQSGWERSCESRMRGRLSPSGERSTGEEVTAEGFIQARERRRSCLRGVWVWI